MVFCFFKKNIMFNIALKFGKDLNKEYEKTKH
jgi:hypothetical protein